MKLCQWNYLLKKHDETKQPQLHRDCKKLKKIPVIEIITLAFIYFFTTISVKRCKIKWIWLIKMKIKTSAKFNKGSRTKTIEQKQ